MFEVVAVKEVLLPQKYHCLWKSPFCLDWMNFAEHSVLDQIPLLEVEMANQTQQNLTWHLFLLLPKVLEEQTSQTIELNSENVGVKKPLHVTKQNGDIRKLVPSVRTFIYKSGVNRQKELRSDISIEYLWLHHKHANTELTRIYKILIRKIFPHWELREKPKIYACKYFPISK